MNRSSRVAFRPLLLFSVLLTLISLGVQPAISLHAQEDPPATPTALVAPAASEQNFGAVLKDSTEGRPPAQPAPGLEEKVQPEITARAPSRLDQLQASPKVIPQTTQPPNTFHVNIVAKSLARADSLLTYSIFFTNTSSLTYQNVWLQNGIGDGHLYLGCDDAGTCPFTSTGDLVKPTIIQITGNGNDPGARQIVWNLGTVSPGQKGKISYTVRVWRELFPQTGRPARVLGNTVALYKDGAIGLSTKLNEDQWGVIVSGPVFNLTKDANKLQLLEGDTIQYTISVGNASAPEDSPDGVLRPDAEPATNVVVFDIVPPQLTNIVPLDDGVVSVSGGETRVTWTLPSLPIGAASVRQLRFSATVKNTLTECGGMSNSRFYVTSNEMPYQDAANGIRYLIPPQRDATSYIIPPAIMEVQATPGGVYVGETVTWLITAKNYWSSAITGANVKFNLPPAFTYVSSTDGGVFNGTTDNSVTWSNVTIPVKTSFDAPGVKQFTVVSKAGRVIDGNSAYAQILQPLPGGIPGGCLRTATGGVGVEPLLYATKTVDKSTAVLSGTNVIYTVVLNNMHSQPMTDVSLVDTFPRPSGFPFAFVNMVEGPAPTSVTSTQIHWSNITVPGGSKSLPGKTTLRFVMKARGLPGDCEANQVLPNSTVSQARQVGGGVVCLAYPWGVTKTVDRTTVNPRDTNRTLLFTLTFESFIDGDALVEPRDRYLQQSQYYYIFKEMVQGPNPISTIPDQDGAIRWPVITLHGHEKITYKFRVDLPVNSEGLITPGLYCNRGELDPLQEPYYLYARPDACTRSSSIELNVSKDVNRHDPGLGELLTYVIALENRSETDAVGQLIISDTLPVNMTYVGPGENSPAPTVTTLPNGRQHLRWENVLAPPNARTTLSFQVRAPALLGTYRNEVEVWGGNPVPAFTCSTLLSNGNCLSFTDLKVWNWVSSDLEAKPALPKPGDIVSYTLSLVSNNNIPYENVVVTDTMPLGFTFVEMVEGPSPVIQGNKLIWRNQTLPALAGPTAGRLTFKFLARAPLSYGSFRSQVEASSTTGVIPTADNIGGVLIIPPTPALTLVGPTLIEIGSSVSFKISLINPLASPLTDITLTNPLPTGFTFTGVETGSPAPTVNNQTLTWNIATVPARANDGTPGIVEILYHVTAPSTEGSATNTVTATGGGPGVTIDQTYNTLQLIIAKLKYVFLPVVMVS